MSKCIKILFSVAVIIISCGCSNGGGGAAGAVATDNNKFTKAGTSISVDDLVSGYTASAISPLSTSQTYYGRVLYKSGSNLYGGVIHFTLNKNNTTTAYFSNFFLDYLVQLTSYTTATTIVSSSTDLTVTAAYNASTNSVSVASAAQRFLAFNIHFGNNTYFADVLNAGVIFSSDFNTMVGGNNSSFFFIAQKASSISVTSISDLLGSWSLANFRVNSSGAIAVSSTSVVTVGGTGGNGFTSFTGSNSSVGALQGETTLTNSPTGVFIFGYDTGAHNPPTASGSVDGVFLLSPDKRYVLGYDVTYGTYFAASR